MTFGVTLFFLVQSDEFHRFGQIEQAILGDLHKWTNGEIWSRLVILDRIDFSGQKIELRSITKDRSPWSDSQSDKSIETLKKLVLKVARQEKWVVSENGVQRPLRKWDLSGIKRLPFDASQTVFCDRTIPGCKPTSTFNCENYKFKMYCSKMPIWENEAPDELRFFDEQQDDSDDYHENEFRPFLYWENIGMPEKTKYFFFEQLKAMSQYIKQEKTKINPDKVIKEYKREINQWNEIYKKKFITNQTSIATCADEKNEAIKKLKKPGKCNVWGNWFKTKKCPKCGSGNFAEERNCYNYGKTRKFDR